ncbi:MAG: hypothetical protein Q9191_005462, partial [Dirinaria sp. TL-2023a]
MTATSFKKDAGPRPLRYRTPSPPRHAVEPVSPLVADLPTEDGEMRWPNKRSYHNRASSGPLPQLRSNAGHSRAIERQGAMDAFASIALATGSNGAPRRSSHQDTPLRPTNLALGNQAERPTKRARSEKLPSPDTRGSAFDSDTRPATSYHQSSDSRFLEAELLLNFAQEARFSVPPQLPIQSASEASPKQSTHPSILGKLDLQPVANEEKHWEHNEHVSSAPKRVKTVGEDNASAADEPLNKPEEKAYGKTLLGPTSIAQPASQITPSVTGNALTHDQELTPGHKVDVKVGEESFGKNSAEGTTVAEILTKNSAGLSGHTEFIQQPEELHTSDSENHIKNCNLGITANILPKLAQNDRQEQGEIRADGIQGDLPQTRSNQFSDNLLGGSGVPRLDGSVAPRLTDMGVDSAAIQNEGTTTEANDAAAPAVCAGCKFTRNIINGEVDPSATSWISCDACKSWYHFACAGFKNEREVRGVDKYRCRTCRPVHGATTYVRKSSRAHSSIDYAGLHQGVIKTSDDTPEHHYIKPIKEGTLSFQPETFARMRPELVTAEYFEKLQAWKEPIVVPAAFNPQPLHGTTPEIFGSGVDESHAADYEGSDPDGWLADDPDYQYAPDHGQDALDMVMPHGLTVRTVAELYGPEEKVEVIDVKSQNGEGKKWNMRRWADYYESKGDKIVRNVISLEVSQSKLGRLIRRPQIVRDLDLQDSVWPLELQAKGEIPRVQFYCLMSVADCFTDFHIDFGGSSVFYHILKGKKTFFFIPPKEKNLKKYEEWCLSPAQNWTFLGDQTKECYRVDLSEGDTMFIPAGWVHAVWTPEDSLVIGGNFLTRLNYGMQFRIAQIEKATGVARKFRYPHFQKIHWYTAFRYIEEDPLPQDVKTLIQHGGVFHRERPAHHDFNDWGENSRSGPENYHARYYSQAELEGLPELLRYLLRTALIDVGSITDGITAEARNAVKRSIPRSHGEPLDVLKTFAAWCAWKRGNETIPSWAYPDAVPEPESAAKLSAAAQKKLDREAALQAPRRQSARMQSQQQQQQPSESAVPPFDVPLQSSKDTILGQQGGTSNNDSSPQTQIKRKLSDSDPYRKPDTHDSPTLKRRRTASGTIANPHRKVACESCRKRRRACKHKQVVSPPHSNSHMPAMAISVAQAGETVPENVLANSVSHGIDAAGETDIQESHDPIGSTPQAAGLSPNGALDPDQETLDAEMDYLLKHPDEIASTPKMLTHLSGAGLQRLEHRIAGGPVNGLSVLSLNAPHSRGRTKACNDCRKSKVGTHILDESTKQCLLLEQRRCIHDEYGNEDPVKARESAIPRPAAAKRRKVDSEGNEIPSAKKLRRSAGSATQVPSQLPYESNAPVAPMSQQAPTAPMMPSGPDSENSHQQQYMPSAIDQIQAAAAQEGSPDATGSFSDLAAEEQADRNSPTPA